MSCPTLCDLMDCSLPFLLSSWDFPGKNWSWFHFLHQGIFLTRWLSSHLLHWQSDSLLLSHQGSPQTFSSVQSLSRVQLVATPMDCSMPGLPVHHQLPEVTQTHVHWVGDAITPSHPLLSPLLLASIFPSIRVFSTESALSIRWPQYWSFSFSISPSNEHPGLIAFRMD